jgi:hypothetical protein
MGARLPLTISYRLEPEDIRAGVRVMLAPSPLLRRSRAVLLKVVWALWVAAGGLLGYILLISWRRACAVKYVSPGVHVTGRAALAFMAAAWAGTGWLAGVLSLRPDAIHDRVCAFVARRMLARSAPGPRTLTVSPEGIEIKTPGTAHVRPWGSIRQARRDEGHLALGTKGLWIFIPLRALDTADRLPLIEAVEARTRVLVLGPEPQEPPAAV